MQTSDFNMLAEAMSVLEAKEMLRDLKVSTYPTLKKEAKKDLKESLVRQANKVQRENAPQKSNREIAQMLGMI